MAHHKRGRPKNRRAGCLHCKPHKANGCHEPRLQERRADLTLREDLVRIDDWNVCDGTCDWCLGQASA